LFFKGINILSVDAKGRIAIPTRCRDQLLELSKGQLVITADPDGCLLIFTDKQFEEVQAKIGNLPAFDPKSREIQRLIIGYGTEVEMDSQGRVTLPAPHREFADLSKRAVLIGQNKKFELWDEERWNAKNAAWKDGSLRKSSEGGDALAEITM
jgi:MraZ protein